MLAKVGVEYLWQGGYETKHLPKEAGFRWDPERKVWWTKFQDSAAKLLNYANPELKIELEAYLAVKAATIEASKATSSDTQFPHPKGLDYLPFQKAGIEYALQRSNTLFGDEMGLGKTIEAIGVLNSTDAKKVLIICPASLKLNWAKELQHWLTRPLSVGIAAAQEWPNTDVVITNYDILVKHNGQTKGQEWDLLVADECHLLKNPEAQRTQQVLGQKARNGNWISSPISAKRKLFLTGTPIVNRPIELWPLVNALAPEVFSSFWGYAKRYCAAYGGKYGWDFSGASNLSELQEKLRSSVMVRRLKAEVLAELPPKRRQIIELPANGAAAVVDEERRAMAAHQETLVSLRTKVETAKAGTEDEYKAAVEALKKGSQEAFTEIARQRHMVALAKVPQVIEQLRTALEEHKVVCFAHHHDVIAAIALEFSECAVLTGENTLQQRQDAIDKFQNDPDCRLFIGSTQAAGLGITLTAASHVVFAELDWVPGNITQAEDRCHRIGQRDSVLVQHLVLEGSLDSVMAKKLVAKQEIIDQALDKEIEREPIIPFEEPVKIEHKELETEITPKEV